MNTVDGVVISINPSVIEEENFGATFSPFHVVGLKLIEMYFFTTIEVSIKACSNKKCIQELVYSTVGREPYL